MELKGSRTEANLYAAFAGESQARNKYSFFAKQARKDGYQQIADLFEETAGNEMQHAKIWFKLIMGGDIKDTITNLKAAAEGEHYEWTEMYAEFAEQAKEEGFNKIAFLFETVGKIEKDHEERYIKLLDNINEGKVFEREENETWVCKVCGNVHVGKKAPERCSVCDHPQSYFELKSSNY